MKIRKLLAVFMLAGVLGLTGCEQEPDVGTEVAGEQEQQDEADDKDEQEPEQEEKEDEDVKALREKIIGTWGNEYAFSDDETMSFSMGYYTQFNEDGTVVQKGYRNTDSGTYQIIDKDTIKATFDHNCYEDPADPDNHDPIKDYIYTVEYEFEEEDGTLEATYSENFHKAVMSNATDGLLRKE